MSELGGGNCFPRLLLGVNVSLALVEGIVAFVVLFQVLLVKVWAAILKALLLTGFNAWFRNTKDRCSRRDFLGLALGVSSLFVGSLEGKGAGLPPEDKPKLCDEACEKELENVPMVTTESGLQYKDIKVGQGPSPPVGFQVWNFF
ncbi:peptidyl-prolyl cis-trans isomerase FKBP16-3, chloroplastic-like [Arachis ipaensis]|uniref:peptidyl-prolyl cis-trans isomerase FKBP16-3, chloroplastic-like n=1 Tax=Arachis ipaensis TaxID=130454 RepID=UPI000A2B230F|nr:peptidyl-prolyl cis-trans isomerase FKBP16-3, chloroplastic-like [Arachis ipaensis]